MLSRENTVAPDKPRESPRLCGRLVSRCMYFTRICRGPGGAAATSGRLQTDRICRRRPASRSRDVLSFPGTRRIRHTFCDALLHQSASLQRRRIGARPLSAGDVLAGARLQPASLCLVRANARGTLYHYRANTYDQTIAYIANKLWQRPRDISLAIDFLLKDPAWAKAIDAEQIGVAGHSQGGFTSLWIGGAKVDADKYLAFQKGWKCNQMVPAYLRDELPLDASPALDVRDPRIKAAFAMAPGIIKAFGMDAAGLAQMTIPAYITVGARDTQTPAEDNAAFAAKHIPNAELVIIPGPLGSRNLRQRMRRRGPRRVPRGLHRCARRGSRRDPQIRRRGGGAQIFQEGAGALIACPKRRASAAPWRRPRRRAA